jgi:hypothetical protein
MTSSATRLRQEGLNPAMVEKATRLIERTLIEEGPSTRIALRERLERAGVPVAGQALIHVLYRAALDGICVRGPMAGREHAYALVRDWLGEPPAVERDRALAELARRYLAGHGPATERDLARWAGLPLRDARAGLRSIAAELHQDSDGLVDLAGRRRPAQLPAPRLLGAFEPLLLGWTSREQILGQDPRAIVTGGMFRNFALVDGRAVAGWRLERDRVVIGPFVGSGGDALGALERDGVALRSFLGLS